MTGAEFFSAVRRGLAAGRIVSEPEAEGLTPASVLMPLFEEDGEVGLLFLRRSDRLGHHPGQIAFPGGRREGAEDDLTCALRETREEIGLAAEELEIFGKLGRRRTTTGFAVTPFVGRLLRWPVELRADPAEVAAVLPIPVRRLIEPGALRTASFTPAGPAVDFFVVDDVVVWGATARMVRQLLELTLGRRLTPRGEVPWDKVRW